MEQGCRKGNESLSGRTVSEQKWRKGMARGRRVVDGDIKGGGVLPEEELRNWSRRICTEGDMRIILTGFRFR